MSRPRLYEKRVELKVRIDPDLRDRLHAEADEREVSVTYLVNRALLAYLYPKRAKR